MAFGTDLQGWSSHKALLSVQDLEICLMEVMKKFLSSRIKTDRDYSSSLSSIIATGQKLDPSDFSTPLCQVWIGIMKQTETLVHFINANTERLCSDTLQKLQQIINDKKMARKLYSEQRNRMELELYRLQEEVNKFKSEYERRSTKLLQNKTKYEEILNKGRITTKLDEIKNKCINSEVKVLTTHNAYVLSLCELNLYQQHYTCVTLPGLLDLQQRVQEDLVRQCQEFLVDYAKSTNWSGDNFRAVHDRIQSLAFSINSRSEYSEFVNKYRSDPVKYPKQEFSSSFLNNVCPLVTNSDIIVNEWTVDAVKQSKSVFTEHLTRCRQTISSKRLELQQLEAASNHSINSQNSIHTLKRELFELGCNEEKYSSLLLLVTDPLNKMTPSTRLTFQPQTPTVIESNRQIDGDYVDAAKPANNMHQTFTQIKSVVIGRRKSHGVAVKKESGGTSGNENDVVTPVADLSGPSLTSSNSLDSKSEASLSLETVSDEPQQTLWPSEDELRFDTDVGAQQEEFVNETSVEEEKWFHGVLPREEVHRLLVNDGDFLVRVSHNRTNGVKQYVLSVMWSAHKHFIIQKSAQSGWHFEAESFQTIQQLVRHYLKTGQRVTRKSTAIIKNPVCRMVWELRNDDVELLHKIGSGQFGEVYQGSLKSKDNLIVAVKTCKDSLSEEVKKRFLQEARILQQYDHPNIVRFIGIAAQHPPVMIIMEYVPGGCLLSYLRKRINKVEMKTLLKMCEDAAAGMAYLEGKNCLHRDLAARNCLVATDEAKSPANVTVKISDFGMSREEQQYVVTCGTRQIPIKWTAPEALSFGIYTTASDVWSYGILVWEIFSFGALPYPGLTNAQARDKVEQGYRMTPPESMPDLMYNLLMSCWQQEPQLRPSFTDVCSQLKTIHQSLLH